MAGLSKGHKKQQASTVVIGQVDDGSVRIALTRGEVKAIAVVAMVAVLRGGWAQRATFGTTSRLGVRLVVE